MTGNLGSKFVMPKITVTLATNHLFVYFKASMSEIKLLSHIPKSFLNYENTKVKRNDFSDQDLPALRRGKGKMSSLSPAWLQRDLSQRHPPPNLYIQTRTAAQEVPEGGCTSNSDWCWHISQKAYGGHPWNHLQRYIGKAEYFSVITFILFLCSKKCTNHLLDTLNSQSPFQMLLHYWLKYIHMLLKLGNGDHGYTEGIHTGPSLSASQPHLLPQCPPPGLGSLNQVTTVSCPSGWMTTSIPLQLYLCTLHTV